MALHIKRARKWDQDLIFPVRALFLGPDHPVIDGADAVAEFRLRGA